VDEMKGRFARLLPTKVPDAGIREVAKAMLKVKGIAQVIAQVKPAATPRLPRSGR